MKAQVVKYYLRPAKTHRTNIQSLLEISDTDPIILETVPPVTKPPGLPPPHGDSKDEAIEQEAGDAAETRIYTDGSSQDVYVGAAAVLYHVQNGILDNPIKVLKHRLGPDSKHSVWDAEAAGLIMALWMLKDSNRLRVSPISIYSDSQAVIRAFRAQRASPGYHLIDEITTQTEILTH